tara:strand:- start:660 stop:1076 length:417 start_codon:yes stop_codon:yes gene_type:complete
MSLAAEILKALNNLGNLESPAFTPSHGQISKVVGMCKDAVAKEKIDARTRDLYEIIPRVREIAEAASSMACQLDSFHEGYPTWRVNQLLDEITDKVSAECQGVNEAATNLERIADDYEDKVNARLHELDPEGYPEEEE